MLWYFKYVHFQIFNTSSLLFSPYEKVLVLARNKRKKMKKEKIMAESVKLRNFTKNRVMANPIINVNTIHEGASHLQGQAGRRK